MPKELPIPTAALDHPSIEMIRVWIANDNLQVVLNIGHWEASNVDERSAWGLLLADMVYHIANAHADRYERDPAETIAIVRRAFEAEMDHATSSRQGAFVEPEQEN